MNEEDFLSVVDIAIQRKDFFVLEPFYANLDFVKKYVNKEDKLKVLKTTDFYTGYFEYIKTETNKEIKFKNLLKLWKLIKNDAGKIILLSNFSSKLWYDPNYLFPYLTNNREEIITSITEIAKTNDSRLVGDEIRKLILDVNFLKRPKLYTYSIKKMVYFNLIKDGFKDKIKLILENNPVTKKN